MPESLPSEILALRDRTETLAKGVFSALRDNEELDAKERAARVRAASKEAGLYAIFQPAEGDGGPRSISSLALVVVRDTLAANNVAELDGLFGPGPGFLAGVGEPLRSSHLLPLLAGDKRGGFAFTEPAGTARPTWARVEGDEIVINGAKSYVTRGADADFLNALVEIDGEGPSMVVIDTTAPGVSMARRFTTIDGHQHAGFELREVRVPRTNIIGRAGEGTNRAMREITATRLAIAALCVGSTRWILDYATAHLTAPGRGGAPRGAGERIRLRFGDMTIKAFAARSMLYRTARLEDAGENVINEAIACKVFASETVGEVADTAIQLVGGDALIVDHPLVQVANRMRSFRLAEGESDTLRVNIARGRLDLGKGRV